jgi:predicted RNA-binding protein with TRAM domain
VTLRPGTVGEVTFSDLLANGQAVGRFDGMVVFVDGPLPGERARVRLREVKAKYAVGELVELLSTSPDRAEPFCAVFGACGGCQVQHLSYPAQLRWKQRIVADALARIGGLEDVVVQPPVGMDEPRAYRNKMALVAEQRDGETILGLLSGALARARSDRALSDRAGAARRRHRRAARCVARPRYARRVRGGAPHRDARRADQPPRGALVHHRAAGAGDRGCGTCVG